MPQVPFLSREREAASGQAVVLEALQALYNICKFNRRVHLEVAATGGIVPHLCRWEGRHGVLGCNCCFINKTEADVCAYVDFHIFKFVSSA